MQGSNCKTLSKWRRAGFVASNRPILQGGTQIKRFLADERGAALAEAVVVLPIIIALIFAAFALAWGLTAKSVVQGAARDAAREYAITGSAAQATSMALDTVRLGGFRASGGNPNVSLQPRTPARGYVTADVLYKLDLPFGGGSGVLQGAPRMLNIAGSAVFRCSADLCR